jgi:cell division protein FtsB
MISQAKFRPNQRFANQYLIRLMSPFLLPLRRSASVFARVRPYLPTAIIALLIVYFGWQALTGDRGLLGQGARKAALAQETTELQRLEAQRHELETRVELLRDDHLSRDLLEERAHVILGFADPRDYVIRIQGPRPARS